MNRLLDEVLTAHGGAERWQQWRRLQATFPAQIATHCQRQTFYVDTDGLIHRHDFVALHFDEIEIER